MVNDPADRLLGIDLGASRVKIALCTSDGQLLHGAHAPSHGCSLALLSVLLKQTLQVHPEAVSLRIGICGSGKALLGRFPFSLAVNEVFASALAARTCCPAARTLIDLGGQSSKWILLGGSGPSGDIVRDFATNGLCAAGAGAFLEQQASRLSMPAEGLGRLAAGGAPAEPPSPVVAACSPSPT